MVSCSEFNFEEHYIKEDSAKKAEFAANWSATFGKIDSKQDWNAVNQVTAYVDFDENDNLSGCILKVYNGNPSAETSELLAKYEVTDPKMEITFDVLKTMQFVYIVREKADGYYAAQIAEISNGNCYASFATGKVATRGVAPLTRSVGFWSGVVPAGQYPDNYPSYCYDISGIQSDEINHNNVDGSNTLYIHSAQLSKINFWNGGMNIYIGGDVVVDDWYVGGNSNIYVLAGSSLTIRKNGSIVSLAQYNTTYTVCPDAKMRFPEEVEFAQGQIFYNAGTVNAAKLTVSNNSVFYNENIIAVTGQLYLANEQSVLVNGGSISAATMNCDGSSQYFGKPQSSVLITGATNITSNRAVWYNMGHFTTHTMDVTAASDNWINACSLKVTDKLSIWPGNGSGAFHNESYIECNSYYQNVARMELSANAQLSVNGTATFKYNCYRDKGEGIISLATGADWAVFKANKVTFENNQQHGSISYVGNLIVDCSNYPERTTDNGSDSGYNWSLFNGAKLASSGDGYTIPADDCREPYNPSKPIPTPENPGSYIIACEDLGTTNDIDFNDIVIKIEHTSGSSTATVTPLAAGGTLRSNLLFQGQNLGEIHYLINGSMGETGAMEMLNTNYGGNNPGPGAPIQISVSPNFTLSYNDGNMGGFSIVTYQENNDSPLNSVIIRAPEQGVAPQMILVPGNWQWPTERVQVYSAYPKFRDWSQSSGRNPDWYNEPSASASIMNL